MISGFAAEEDKTLIGLSEARSPLAFYGASGFTEFTNLRQSLGPMSVSALALQLN